MIALSLFSPSPCALFRHPHHLCIASLDVKDVGYVIVSSILTLVSYSVTSMTNYSSPQNYDFPNNCEDYIHRIGRTGVSSHDQSRHMFDDDVLRF